MGPVPITSPSTVKMPLKCLRSINWLDALCTCTRVLDVCVLSDWHMTLGWRQYIYNEILSFHDMGMLSQLGDVECLLAISRLIVSVSRIRNIICRLRYWFFLSHFFKCLVWTLWITEFESYSNPNVSTSLKAGWTVHSNYTTLMNVENNTVLRTFQINFYWSKLMNTRNTTRINYKILHETGRIAPIQDSISELTTLFDSVNLENMADEFQEKINIIEEYFLTLLLFFCT